MSAKTPYFSVHIFSIFVPLEHQKMKNIQTPSNVQKPSEPNFTFSYSWFSPYILTCSYKPNISSTYGYSGCLVCLVLHFSFEDPTVCYFSSQIFQTHSLLDNFIFIFRITISGTPFCCSCKIANLNLQRLNDTVVADYRCSAV